MLSALGISYSISSLFAFRLRIVYQTNLTTTLQVPYKIVRFAGAVKTEGICVAGGLREGFETLEARSVANSRRTPMASISAESNPAHL